MKTIMRKLTSIPLGVRASIAYFVASIISSGMAYITTPIFTRMMSSTEYGQVAVFYTWFQLFAIVAMFCLSYGVFNNGMVDFPNERDEYVFSMLILSNIITTVFAVVFIVLYPLVEEVLGLGLHFFILMCVSYIFQPAFRFWIGKQRYEMKYKGVLVWSSVQAIISPAFAILCMVLIPGNNLYCRIYGAELSLIVIYAGFYIYLATKNKLHIETKYWKFAFTFNLPLIPHYLSLYLLGSSDKLMISYIVSNSATAYYSVAHSIAAFASIIWSAINGSLIPYTYEMCKNEQFENINKTTKPILTVFACACTTIILFAPEVVALMAPGEYLEAIYVIPPIIASVFFQVQYFLYSNIVYYYKKPVYVMLGSITAVILNLVLNYIFISKYGYLAAGYTTLACYIVQAFIDYFAMKKVIQEQVYNIKFILFLSISLIAFAILSITLYDFAIARYFLLLIIITVGVLNRKRIYKAFKL